MPPSDFRERLKGVAAPARRLARRALGVPSGGEYAEAVGWFNARIDSVDSHASTVEEQIAQLSDRNNHTADRQADTLESLLAAGQRARRLIDALEARIDQFDANVDTVGTRVDDLYARSHELGRRADQLDRRAVDLHARSAELGERADDSAKQLEALRDILHELAQRVDAISRQQERQDFELPGRIYLASPGLLDVVAPDGRETLGFDSMTPLGAADYRSLEDVLRGSEQFIKERLRAYLKFFSPGEEAVDLGSGRGEMLELLAEAGVDAIGVDSDTSMVSRAETKGLRCTHADALEWLRNREKKSLDVVFSAQFVEHLPTGLLPELFATARECLRPGGRLIAETVNPYCPSALRSFWVDPSHVQPLYPETLLLLLHQAGFTSGYVVYPASDEEPEVARSRTGEYAVVATT